MKNLIRGAILSALAVMLITPVIGCSEREHRKVRVVEEQREGEVEEEKPGEMVVE